MFRPLHAHLQEALHKQLVYYVRVMSAARDGVDLVHFHSNPDSSQQALLDTWRGG
jgi:hypothetical protein